MNNKTIEKIEIFWNWFIEHQQQFFDVVKSQNDIPENFFNHIEPYIKNINKGFFFLTGMYQDDVAELIITPDGIVKNIVFAEEMITKAPQLPNWKFTALKPAMSSGLCLKMHDYTFGEDTLSFYATNENNCPDNINIVVVCKDFPEEDKEKVTNGVYIFLDNYLGELKFATSIDHISVIPQSETAQELIPMEKLKSYLAWREKEFVEKYETIRHNTENDTFSNFQGELSDGKPLFAIVDKTLLNWDRKASHPWILEIVIDYECSDESGLPDSETDDFMNDFEDEINEKLKDVDGNLFVIRETYDAQRCLLYACIDFRNPSKVMQDLKNKYNKKYEQLDIQYNIYKDKYWDSFNRYQQN